MTTLGAVPENATENGFSKTTVLCLPEVLTALLSAVPRSLTYLNCVQDWKSPASAACRGRLRGGGADGE